MAGTKTSERDSLMDDLLFKFFCPVCEAKIQADVIDAGDNVPCPGCGETITVPMDLVGPGTALGQFHVQKEIGEGGMGKVYLAKQITLGRPVALKVLSPALSRNEEFVSTFLREMQVQGSITHPNIAAAIDAGSDRGNYFLAMEFIDGRDLESILEKRNRLPEEEALRIARDVAAGMRHAWKNRQVVHHDIKPGNIMIDDLGAVKLLDLGLATSIAHTNPRDEAEERYMVGTPQYMPPEQARGLHGGDFRSDIYALGGTLYHMLTGEPPHSGSSVTEVTEKQKYEAPQPIQELNPEISDPTCKLVDRMLAKEPLDRFSSWDVVIRGLDLLINYKRNDGQAALTANKSSTSPLRSGLVVFAGIALIAWAWAFANKDKDNGSPPIVEMPAPEVLRPEPAPNLVDIPEFEPATNQLGVVSPGFGLGEVTIGPDDSVSSTSDGSDDLDPALDPTGSSNGEAGSSGSLATIDPPSNPSEDPAKKDAANAGPTDLTPERIHEELESILAEAEVSLEFNRQHTSRLDKLANRADRAGYGELALEIEQEQEKLDAEYQAALFAVILELRNEAENLVAQGAYAEAIDVYKNYNGDLARQTTPLRMKVVRVLEQDRREYDQQKAKADLAWRELVDTVTSDLIRERSLGAAWGSFTTADPIIEEIYPSRHANLRQKFIDIGNVEALLLQSFDRQKGASVKVSMADGRLLEGRVLGSSGTEIQLEQKLVGAGTGVRRIEVADLSFPEKENRIRDASPHSADFILGMSSLSRKQDSEALGHFEQVEAPFGPLLAKKLLDPAFRIPLAEDNDDTDGAPIKGGLKKPGEDKLDLNKSLAKPFKRPFKEAKATDLETARP